MMRNLGWFFNFSNVDSLVLRFCSFMLLYFCYKIEVFLRLRLSFFCFDIVFIVVCLMIEDLII